MKSLFNTAVVKGMLNTKLVKKKDDRLQIPTRKQYYYFLLSFCIFTNCSGKHPRQMTRKTQQDIQVCVVKLKL